MIPLGNAHCRPSVTNPPHARRCPTLRSAAALGEDTVKIPGCRGPARVGGGHLSPVVARRRFAAWATALAVLLATVASAGPLSAAAASGALSQQGGKFTAPGGVGGGFFGDSVALSADGNTALIGAPGEDAAWVFTRSGSTWAESAKLTTSEVVGRAEFGSAVALSGNADIALIGAAGNGAAWMFTRSGSTWSQLPEKKFSGPTGFGSAVALSSDGKIALIGAPGEFGNNESTAIAFVHSGSAWNEQGALQPKGVTESLYGSAVALSEVGSTAIVGGPFEAEAYGAAWVFTRSGETWSQQSKALEPPGSTGGEYGTSVALSAEGNTALVGGPIGGGAVAVYTRSGSTWTQQGELLTGNGSGSKEQFGQAAALSADGDTALIGAPGAQGGVAWLFTRSGSTWTRQDSELGGCEESGEARFGDAVALSSDASAALIGGAADNANTGAAWPFAMGSGGACSPGGGEQHHESPPPPGSKAPPDTKITTSKIQKTKHSATFTFTGVEATTGFQCELITPQKKRHHKRAHHFTACRSPKTYKHLVPGRYTFTVRAVHGSEPDPTPALKKFKI
jgi:FG-GAP repeat